MKLGYNGQTHEDLRSKQDQRSRETLPLLVFCLESLALFRFDHASRLRGLARQPQLVQRLHTPSWSANRSAYHSIPRVSSPRSSSLHIDNEYTKANSSN